MSIKSYLRTLFKLSSGQSAPKAESYISIPLSQGDTEYTAPADGYVSFAVSGKDLIRVTVDGACESCVGVYGSITSVSSSQWIRVNKGDVVKFRIETLNEYFWARFIRTVAWGVKTLFINYLSGGRHAFA